MMRLHVFIVFLVLGATAFAWESKKANLAGLDGFVERMGAGIREQALGNTGVADREAQPGAFWNPALVASSRQGIVMSVGGEQRSMGRTGTQVGVQSGVGTRGGVGFALLGRGDTDFEVVNEEDEDLGQAYPYFYMAYIAVGWRLNRYDLLGVSFSRSGENLGVAQYYSELRDDGQSPTSYNLGWHHTWSSRFETGMVVRNLGFNSDLSARWTRNPSNGSESQALRPKTLEMGATYSTKVKGRPFGLRVEVLDYLLADTLFVFDPDWHYWTARFGAEWEPISGGWLRAGFDSKNLTCGLGYQFNLRWNKKPWPLQLDWVFVYETLAGQWNPVSVGVRTRIP
jgi:hypothetical protein